MILKGQKLQNDPTSQGRHIGELDCDAASQPEDDARGLAREGAIACVEVEELADKAAHERLAG